MMVNLAVEVNNLKEQKKRKKKTGFGTGFEPIHRYHLI